MRHIPLHKFVYLEISPQPLLKHDRATKVGKVECKHRNTGDERESAQKEGFYFDTGH